MGWLTIPGGNVCPSRSSLSVVRLITLRLNKVLQVRLADHFVCLPVHDINRDSKDVLKEDVPVLVDDIGVTRVVLGCEASTIRDVNSLVFLRTDRLSQVGCGSSPVVHITRASGLILCIGRTIVLILTIVGVSLSISHRSTNSLGKQLVDTAEQFLTRFFLLRAVLIDADDALASNDDHVSIHCVQLLNSLSLENIKVDVIEDLKCECLLL